MLRSDLRLLRSSLSFLSQTSEKRSFDSCLGSKNTCHNFNGSRYFYDITYSFASPSVIYVGWRGEFNFIKSLWTGYDAFFSEKYTSAVIDF